MLSKAKSILRRFSKPNYQEKLESFKPLINSDIPHPAFPSLYINSSLPVLLGGLASVALPALGIFESWTPELVLYTMIYSSLHTTLLAGTHLGLASVFYEDHQEDSDSTYLRKQLVYPFFAPIFTTFLTCSYWAFPLSHLKSLYAISGIGVIYLGVFIGDNFFGERLKVVPVWYLKLKRNVTVISVLGIIFLLLGVYAYPQQTKLPNDWAGFKKVNSRV
jgi:hypothetical protein